MLEKADLFHVQNETRRSSTGKIKTKCKFFIPINLYTSNLGYTSFSKIVPAEKVTNETLEDRVKFVFKGYVKVSSSNKFVSVLNISKSKKFRVNEVYLKILWKIFDLQSTDI